MKQDLNQPRKSNADSMPEEPAQSLREVVVALREAVRQKERHYVGLTDVLIT